jgi:hypothetical protein
LSPSALPFRVVIASLHATVTLKNTFLGTENDVTMRS